MIQRIRRSFREKKKGSYNITNEDTDYENVEPPKDNLKWLDLNGGGVVLNNGLTSEQQQHQQNKKLQRPQSVYNYNEYSSSPTFNKPSSVNVNQMQANKIAGGSKPSEVCLVFPVFFISIYIFDNIYFHVLNNFYINFGLFVYFIFSPKCHNFVVLDWHDFRRPKLRQIAAYFKKQRALKADTFV